MSRDYSNDDWQAQLEEVLALQSIFAEEFRVTHIPGQTLQNSSTGWDSSCANKSSSSNGHTSSSTGCQQVEELEKKLQALLGSESPTTSAPRGLLTCEAIVHVVLPAGQLLLVLDTAHHSKQTSACSASSSNSQAHHLQDKAGATRCCNNGSGDDDDYTHHDNSANDNSNNSSAGSSSRMQFGPPIRYLPPILVQLSLPVSYPSCASAAPCADIQACWLSAEHVQQLKQHLQDIWEEQGPGPVCYAWLDFIKESGLEKLGITKELVLQCPQVQQVVPAAAAADDDTQQQQQHQQQDTTASNPSITSVCTRSGSSSSSSSSSNSSIFSKGVQLSAAAAPFEPSSSISHAGGAKQQQIKQQQKHRKPQSSQQQHDCEQPRKQPHKQPSSQRKAERYQGSQIADVRISVQQEQQQQPQVQEPGGQQHLALPSVEQVAVQLLRYSTACEADAFMAARQTCNICFEQVPGSSCLLLPDCRHFYCKDCLKAAAAAQMELGALDNMRCPEPSCRQAMPPYVIKALLGEAGYAKWEEQLLQRALDRMEDVVYCPRCDAVCIEDKDHCAQCGRCLYVFCSFCHDSWHPGTECLDPLERLRVLERRKKATGAGDKHHELDLVNQAMNLKYLSSCSKKCPSCCMATIKNEGCNKMTCVYCRANWCWKCVQVIEGYDHFRDSRCNMFDQEEVNRWNALMWQNERAREVEMGQLMIQVRRDVNPGAMLCRCPVCGQQNLREGRNNLLRCWSCNCHFCYSCRSCLRSKVGQHYIGKGACKQHGD